MIVHYQLSGATAAAISASVEEGIRDDRLAPGAPLPPVRGLAAHLGVSPATVAAAYRTLRERGLVETAGRAGTRVRTRPPVATRGAHALTVPDGVLDLANGGPDPTLLPALGPHLRGLAGDIGPTGYAGGAPLPELVELARRRFSVDGVPAGATTVTGGALDAIERVLAGHLRPGDRIAVEDPGWVNLLDLVAALGLTPVPVPVDDAGPTEEGLRAALASRVRALVVTGRAQNPTGAALTAGRARALRRVLRGYPEIMVIEDDHAAELADDGPYPLIGVTAAWAYVRSVSKPYGPDLRLAVVAGDDATISRVEGRMRLGTGWVSTLLQRLVVRLWSDPAVAATVASAKEEYGRRRTAAREALAERGVTARGTSGINLWIPVPDETAAVAGLREAGIAVAPGSLYRIASPPGIRLTVATLPATDAPRVAAAVAAALRLPRPAGRSA